MIVPNWGSPLKILLVVDGSQHTTAAVNLLTRIMWPAGTFTHVSAIVPERLPLMDSSPEAHSVVAEGLEIVRWRDWAAAKILTTQAADRLRAYDLIVETEICEGSLAKVILQRTADLSADLVVIGTQGFSAPDEFGLGSTIPTLTHSANYSVLVARPWAQVRPLSTILAVDGSPAAWRAVEFLGTLSLPDWAKVTVVSVAEEKVGLPADLSLADHYPLANAWEVIPGATEVHVAKVVEHLHGCGVQARRIIRFGRPVDQILSAAQERDAVLIVIGARNQTRAGFFRWGHVTQQVVKYAPCSVLAVQ